MEYSMDELTFKKALEDHGLIVSDQQMEQFHTYYEMLIEWNQKMNLTAITKKEDVYLKHFYDSLTIAFDHPFTNQNIADVGAGAGFPSIPIKIMYPDIKVTIIDSLNKRITFLNELFKVLGLKDTQAFAARAEDFAKDHRECYDIVVGRAVARLNILDELCLPLVKVDGYFLSLKGKKAEEEIVEAKKGISTLGGVIINDHHFTLSNDEDHRHNIIIKKVKKTPKQYPRAYAKIKKRPL